MKKILIFVIIIAIIYIPNSVKADQDNEVSIKVIDMSLINSQIESSENYESLTSNTEQDIIGDNGFEIDGDHPINEQDNKENNKTNEDIISDNGFEIDGDSQINEQDNKENNKTKEDIGDNGIEIDGDSHINEQDNKENNKTNEDPNSLYNYAINNTNLSKSLPANMITAKDNFLAKDGSSETFSSTSLLVILLFAVILIIFWAFTQRI